MAKVIDSSVDSQVLRSTYSLWKFVLIGVLSGILFWILTSLIERYVINPIFCRSSSNQLLCLNTVSVSGNIATVLVMVIGIVAIVRLRLLQPLIVAVAAGAALWGLAGWTSGLSWGEIVVWDILIYTLAYLSFSWIARYIKIVPVSIIMLLIIISVHIAANL